MRPVAAGSAGSGGASGSGGAYRRTRWELGQQRCRGQRRQLGSGGERRRGGQRRSGGERWQQRRGGRRRWLGRRCRHRWRDRRRYVAQLMSFFITSTGSGTAGGNLGGLAGADAKCQSLAAAVGLGSKTWRAYLSISSADPGPDDNARTRIGSGPWVNAAGVQIAATVARCTKRAARPTT